MSKKVTKFEKWEEFEKSLKIISKQENKIKK